METIGKHEPDGRRVQKIADDIHAHRDTIRRLCEKLEDDHYITRQNKQSAYHLTDKVYGNPANAAPLFQGQALRNIRSWKWMSLTNKFCNARYCKHVYNNFKEVSYIHLRDELTLFEFANRMGALIIFVMIQACRPKTRKIDINNMEIDIDPKGGNKDKIAISWIDSINGSQIFSEFSKMDLVKEGLSRYNPIPFDKDETKRGVIQEFINSLRIDDRKELIQSLNVKGSFKGHTDDIFNIREIDTNDFDNLIGVIKSRYSDFYKQLEKWLDDLQKEYEYMMKRQFDPDNPLWSYYEMHEDNFTRLVKAYTSLYPDIYNNLENVRDEIKNKIERIRATEHDPYHIKCDGQVVSEIETDIIIKGKKAKLIKVEKCLKCGRSINVNKIVKEAN